MNEYLGYQLTILSIYREGNDINETQYREYTQKIAELQILNKKMETIRE